MMEGDKEINRSEANKFASHGNVKVKRNQHEDAVHLFSKAITLFDSDPRFYLNRSYAYYMLEKYEESIRDANKAIELLPDCLKAYYRKG